MKITRSRLAAVIAERSLENIGAKQLGQEVAAYLLSEGRTGELDSLLRDILQYRADHDVVEVITVTAHPLTDEVRRDVTSIVRKMYPSAKQVIVSEEHDETVIGGMKLEFANEQLNLSVRAKLNRFKQLTAATGGM